ncbi:MAG: hypothetical protein QOI25_671 [Mycobacterium sp.]|nr:hypothetical protein [Mycobacterium sp.]
MLPHFASFRLQFLSDLSASAVFNKALSRAPGVDQPRRLSRTSA